MQPSEAAAHLDAMQQSRERLAALASCPPERHMVFALILGGLVASQSLPMPLIFAAEAVLLCAVGVVVAWDRKRTGMFINGYRAGKTRPLTFLLLAFTLMMLALGVYLKLEQGLVGAPAALGVLVAVVAFFASIRWQRIWVRELQDLG